MSDIRNKYEDLFRLVRKKQWNRVSSRVGLFPEESIASKSYTFSNGVTISTLPLHVACMYRAPLKPILALIAADPSTCIEQDGIGRTPLYNAVRYGCEYEVISVLITVCPDSVKIMADDGTLPIHIACASASSSNQGVNTIKHLLWSYPDSILIGDLSGDVPRDCAVKNPNENLTIEILQELDRHEPRLYLERNAEQSNQHYHAMSHLVSSPFNQRELNFSGRLDSSFRTDERLYSTVEETVNSFLDNNLGEVEDTIVREKGSNPEASKSLKRKQCVICMERMVSRILVPCGHPCLCDQCACSSTMDKLRWKCPECRTNVSQLIKFFGCIVEDDHTL